VLSSTPSTLLRIGSLTAGPSTLLGAGRTGLYLLIRCLPFLWLGGIIADFGEKTRKKQKTELRIQETADRIKKPTTYEEL